MIPCVSEADRQYILNIITEVARECFLFTLVNKNVQTQWVKSLTASVSVELVEGQDCIEYLAFEGDLYTCDSDKVFGDKYLLKSAELIYGGRDDRELSVVRGVDPECIEVVVRALLLKGMRVVSDSIPFISTFSV